MFFNFNNFPLYFYFSPCRNLRQPAVGHCDILRYCPPLRLPLCLLEALLAAMAGQGGWGAQPDVGAAARNRRAGRSPRAVPFTPAAAEEGGPVLVLALPLAGTAGTPPLLWPGGARERGGRRGGWRAKRNPRALIPGYGLLPQQCWWAMPLKTHVVSRKLSNKPMFLSFLTWCWSEPHKTF